MKNKLSLILLVLCAFVCMNVEAQSTYDAMAPFGFATRTSRTDASDAAVYNITGGGAITYEEAKASASKIVLTSKGAAAMDTEISNAIKNNSVIIFDGSGANGTDFYLSKYISFDGLKNKTLIGVNGARLCTQFYLTSAIQSMLNNYQWEKNGTTYTGVKKGSTSSNSNSFGNLPNGQSVGEESEYLTRKALMEYLNDNDENFRKAGVFQFKRCENFIIRNIKFVGPGPCDVGGYDLMAMTESTHFWVDHCEFTDGIDGNFDITNNSDYNTVSWCTFSYTDRAYAHMNTNLVGSSDTDGVKDGVGYYLNTTYAYNHWGNKCDQRMPMARSGKIHMLNNYYTCTNNSSSINPRKYSEFYIEGNYFADGVKKVFSQTDATAYQWISSGNRANVIASSGVNTPSSKGTVSIPYSYNNTLAAANVPTEVGRWAGATLFQNAAAPTISISTDKSSVKQGGSITISANTTGYPEPVITWYSCTDVSKNGAQSIGTGISYKPSTTSIGTYYIYAVANNSEGSVTSNVVSYTITENSDVVWTFASGDLKANTTWNGNGKNYFIANGSDEELEFYGNSGSNDKLTEYSQTIDGVTYSSYLNINSTGSASRRYLSFNAPTDKGIITIVCADKARTVTVFDNTLSQTLTTITGVANSAAESSTITTTAGNTIMLYADNQLQVYSVIWTPVTSSDPTPTPVKADVSDEERDCNTPGGWTNVVLPNITIYKTINITDKGASTSSTDNAKAIQAAIDEASNAGGGKVVVPSGTWLCGPIVMKSNVVFHLSAGATLKLLPYGGTGADVAGCYPRSGTNSSGLNNYAVFMTGVSNMTNVIVEGEGETSVIDGQGTGGWWSDYQSLGTRPGLIRFGSGSAFLFRNFKMQNSPGVNLTLGQSGNAHDFTVHHIIIRNPSSEATTPSHNTDGIPVWGPNVNIYNCDISTGDDNIVCDSKAHHVHAWNITCGDGHGMSIGSYTSETHDIIYEDITFNGTGSGFRLKTSPDRSGNDQIGTNGAVKNIICRNATMTGCPSPIKITSWYDSDPADPTSCTSSPVTATTPEFCNILFQNITADAVDGKTNVKHNSPVYMYGRPEMLIHDVTLDNVKINSKRGMFLAYVDPIKFINGCNIVNETNSAERISVNHQATIVGSYGDSGDSGDGTVFSLVNTATSNVTVEHGTDLSLSSYATITGGNAEIHNGHASNDATMISNKGLYFGNSGGSYIKITLDSPLKEGDVLTTTGGDGGLVALSSSNADSDKISGNKFTFPSDYDGKTVIYINRGQSKPTLTSITITRKVTFDVKFYNGTEQVGETQSTEKGQTVSAPTAPEKDGYTFMGWSETNGGATTVTFPYTVTADVNFYAVWEQEQQGEEPSNTINYDAYAYHTSKIDANACPTDNLEGISITYGISAWTVDGGTDKGITCDDDVYTGLVNASSNGAYSQNTSITSGAIVLKPDYNGTISLAIVVNDDKAFYVIDETDRRLIDDLPAVCYYSSCNKQTLYYNSSDHKFYADNTYSTKHKLYGTVEFSVKAGHTYSIGVSGSKMGLYGFKYEYDENANNIQTFSDDTEYASFTEGTYNVKLKRSIPAGSWSTLVVPFDVSTAQLEKTFKDPANSEVAVITKFDGNTLYFKTQNHIKANEPVLIYLSQKNDDDVYDFGNVTVKNGTPESTSGGATMVGTYKTIQGTSLDKTKYYFISGGKFYDTSYLSSMKPFRAYFYIANSSGAKQLNLGFGDYATSISGNSIQMVDTDKPIYNLAGQRVKAGTRGLLIQNGKKIFVK